MFWALAGVFALIVIVIVFRETKSHPARLREEFGRKAHLAAIGCTPEARLLHWEETSVLFQVASSLRPEGRVFPEQRPVDTYLSGLALASLDSIIKQLASSAPGLANKSVESRLGEIRSAARIIEEIIRVQTLFLQGRRLTSDDFTLGYLFGFAIGIGRRQGLDAAQEIVAAAFVFESFYAADDAIRHLSTSWSAQGNRARLRAARFGKAEADEFLRSRRAPLGLMSPPNESVISRFDDPAFGVQPEFDRQSSPANRVTQATESCLEIVEQQLSYVPKKLMSQAYARGYLAGVADATAQHFRLSDEEALVIGAVLFTKHHGPVRGPKIMKAAFDEGEHTTVYCGREDGGQDALEFLQRGIEPRRLARQLSAS
jgi:hypothetical protein